MLKNLYRYDWIVLIALSFILIFVAICVKPSEVTVETLGEWTEPPIVVVCPSSLLNKDEVNSVLERWKERGHQFDALIEMPCDTQEALPGFIFVRSMATPREEDEVGHSHVLYSKETGEIVAVVIELFIDNKVVLEHEVGHALGYLHVKRVGHIMYPNLHGDELNDQGLYKDLKTSK